MEQVHFKAVAVGERVGIVAEGLTMGQARQALDFFCTLLDGPQT